MFVKKLFKGQRLFFTLLLLIGLSVNAQDTNETNEIAVTYTIEGNNTTYQASWEIAVNENDEEIADYLFIETDSEGSIVSTGLIAARDPNYFIDNAYRMSDIACNECLKVINTEKDLSVVGEYLTVIAPIDPTVIVTNNTGTIDFSNIIELAYCNTKGGSKNINVDVGFGLAPSTNDNSNNCPSNTAANNFYMPFVFTVTDARIYFKQKGKSIGGIYNNTINHTTDNGWNLSYTHKTVKSTFMLLGDSKFDYAMSSHDTDDTSNLLEAFIYIKGVTKDGLTLSITERRDFVLSKITQKNAFESEIENVELLPNPCENYMTVNYMLEKDSDVSMAVYNVLGEKMMSQSSFQQAGKNQANFDTSCLPSGTYILNFIGNDKATWSKRFVKH